MKICAEKFINLLKERELHFSTRVDEEDGAVLVDFPYDGKVAKILFNGETGEYASFYLQYESVSAEKRLATIEACNEQNCRFKWVTFYVDKDNDLMLHLDALLSAEDAADEAFEMLVRMINIGKEAKNDLMKAIYA